MEDDEVLDAVKKTLSGVRMDRPIEAIEQRGQARRRNRRLFGAVAGGGLAAVAALALAIPTANHQSGPARHEEAGATASTVLKPAAFTVTKRADGTVTLTLSPKQILDPEALQKALADAGVPAAVKTGAACGPTTGELPQAKKVLSVKEVDLPDGSNRYDLNITPSQMPAGSRIYFSVFATQPGGAFDKAGWFLVSDQDPMNCRTVA